MNKHRSTNKYQRPSQYPSLLASKLNKPCMLYNTIERQRLVEKIDREMKGKVTLVTAPAGFGKTTAACEWLRFNRMPACWVSLDEADNNPKRFWGYLCAALKFVSPGINDHVLPALHSSESPDLETVITRTINYLYSFSEDFALILDDYHVIQHPHIHDIMTYLIQHAPEHMHIMIISRTNPPLRLPQLKAKGKLTEIKAEDLRFTSEETAAFYNQLDIELGSQEQQMLESRTEGWATMIRWAGHFMQGKEDLTGALDSFRGDSKEITSYICEEIFTFWPEHIREFLLSSSIIKHVEAELCDWLTGRTDSKEILEDLSQDNAFVAVVNKEEGLYRYHFLLAQFLQNHLENAWKDRVPLLHQKAARWYEKRGDYFKAVWHYLQGGCHEQVVLLLERKAPEVIKSGANDISTLVNCFTMIPQHVIEASSMLCLTYGWALSMDGKLQESRMWADKAAAANQQEKTEKQYGSIDWKKQIDGEIDLLKAYIALQQKDFLHIIKHGKKASRSLVSGSIFLRDAAIFNHFEASLLTGPFGFYGHLDRKARAFFSNSFEPVLKKIGFPGEYLLIARAELFYEQNELDQALSLLMQGINMAEKTNSFGALIPGYLTLAKICRAKGDLEEALEVINSAQRKVRSAKHYQWIGLLEAVKVRLFLHMGKMEPVEQWMQQNGLSIYEHLEISREFEQITSGYVMMAQKRYDKASLLLTRLQLFAEELDRLPSIIEVLNLQALTFQELGETNKSLSLLNKSLTLGEKEGFLRSFVDHGSPMAVLLTKCIRQQGHINRGLEGVSLKYMRKIIQLIKKESSLRRSNNFLNGRSLEKSRLPLEPLTLKELQILRLLAMELSNQDIADRLSIKLNTVKVHTRHIYHKLEVNNRIRAVERAKALEII